MTLRRWGVWIPDAPGANIGMKGSGHPTQEIVEGERRKGVLLLTLRAAAETDVARWEEADRPPEVGFLPEAAVAERPPAEGSRKTKSSRKESA